MSFKTGKLMKVEVNGNTVVGMGTVSLGGVTTDLLETTEFGDTWKTYTLGLRESGDITFDGLADPDDSTGQDVLRDANANDTDITQFRIYVDNSSFYEPNQTAGTLPSSYVNITAWEISGTKDGLLTASFTAKVSGALVLV